MILNKKNVNIISEFFYNVSLYLLIVGLPIVFSIRPYSSIEATKVVYFEIFIFILSFFAILIYVTSDNSIGKNKSYHNAANYKYVSIFVILLLISFIISVFVSVDISLDIFGSPGSRKGIATLVSLIVFYLSLRKIIVDKHRFFNIVEICVLGSIPVLIYGFMQYFGLDIFNWHNDSISQMNSTFGRSNYFGNYLSILAPMTCFLITIQRKNLYRLLHALILILQISCIYLTLSRGSWISLIVGIFVFLSLIALKKRNMIFWILAAITIIIGSISYYAIDNAEISKIANSGNDTNYEVYREDSINRRLLLWKYIIPLISKKLIFGYGFETFTSIDSVKVINQEMVDNYEAFFDDPHNIIIEYWISSGIVGLIALIGVVVSFVKYCFICYIIDFNNYICYSFIIAFIAAFVIPIQFNPDTIVIWTMFWLILGITPSLLHPARPASSVLVCPSAGVS